MKPASNKNYLIPFILVTSLFFFWGLIHNLDQVLIAHLQKAFDLSVFQATLVDFAVYIAYFVMALPAGAIMVKYGYKTGIILGLLLFGIGCMLFIPAANTILYVFFLVALFILACGLATLETAANPYITILGSPETATQRLNFAQSFNGLAAAIAPIIGGKLILSNNSLSSDEIRAMTESAKQAYLMSETSSVKLPYLVLGLVVLAVALIFFFTKLPDKKEEGGAEKKSLLHAFKYSNLTWAVIAQFFYVGAQVCVLSLLILFAKKAIGIAEDEARWYSGAAGLAFMLGRFFGTFLMRFIQPNKLMVIYSLICISLSAYAIMGTGVSILYAIIGIAFFMSIMFPTIFALGVKGLGSDTKIGSSLIIMSIVGGAALPPVLGLIADKTGSIQNGYIVPLVCFVVVGYFGWKGHRVKVLN